MIGKTGTITAHHQARAAGEALLVAYWADDASARFHLDRAADSLTKAAAALGYDLVVKAAPDEVEEE